MLFWSISQLIAGLLLLLLGADRFIVGASRIARMLRLPPLLAGMLLVGFGTSLPEFLVSVSAAWQHHAPLAVGSAIGSNITNIGLVLGFSALLVPLRVHSRLLRREMPWLMFLGWLIFWMLRDGVINRFDGVVLALLLMVNLWWLFYWVPKHARQDPLNKEFTEALPQESHTAVSLFFFVIGFLLLVWGSKWCVAGAVALATHWHVSQLVIGLTVVAVGTSLPELAASVLSAWRGDHDIAVGNVIGSNIFNLLGVMAAPALLSPGLVSKSLFYRDIPVMLLLIALLWLFSCLPPRRGMLGRGSGILLLTVFGLYFYWVYHGSV